MNPSESESASNVISDGIRTGSVRSIDRRCWAMVTACVYVSVSLCCPWLTKWRRIVLIPHLERNNDGTKTSAEVLYMHVEGDNLMRTSALS